MMLLIVAFVVALVAMIVVRFAYLFSDREAPSVFTYTFLGIGITGFILCGFSESNLIEENEARLKQWTANQCVAPQTIANSVLVARAGGGHGTAFMIDGNTVITNRHVADSISPEAVFETEDERAYNGMMFHRADEATSPDLAFYYVMGGGDIPALKLAKAGPEVGEQVLVVGHNGNRGFYYASVLNVLGTGGEESDFSPVSPLTSAAEFVLYTTLNFFAPSSLVDEGARSNDVIATHGDTAGGNSGSPVVNCAGEVVGVHFAGRGIYFFASEQLGFSVTLDDLNAEIEKLPPADSPPSVS